MDTYIRPPSVEMSAPDGRQIWLGGARVAKPPRISVSNRSLLDHCGPRREFDKLDQVG
jgi:hypothetical protein